MDQSKFTNEGWWANAALRHFLIGHWEIAATTTQRLRFRYGRSC